MSLLLAPLPSAAPAVESDDSRSGATTVSRASTGPDVNNNGDGDREAPAVVNVPLQIIEDCTGRPLVVEMISKEVYRGRLVHFDKGSMNLELSEVTVTGRDGMTAGLDGVYLRGDKVRFIVLPEEAERHPVFKELAELENKPKQLRDLAGGGRGGPRGRGRGRGRGGRGRGGGGRGGRGRGGGGFGGGRGGGGFGGGRGGGGGFGGRRV